MPVDNNGNSFKYISITTLEETSEAIVQPLSRPIGYNRRLVNPMPHPYGSIGEARPTNRLPINVGPRPGAPLKEKYKSPSKRTPARRTGMDRERSRDSVDLAILRATGIQNSHLGARLRPEDFVPVGPNNSTLSEGHLITLQQQQRRRGGRRRNRWQQVPTTRPPV
jgi:hypothetical protein